jgi:hypothetical protein
MFWKCISLEFIDLPQTIATIAIFGFEMCSALKTIVIRRTSICNLASANAFNGTPFRNGQGGTVYVPQTLISSYQNGTNWSALESVTFLPIEGSPYE